MSTALLRRSPAVLLNLVLLATAACGSTTDPAGLTVASVAGAYTLASVDGHAMPAGVTGTSTVTIASGVTRTLNADGTCGESGQYVTANGGLMLSDPHYRPDTLVGTAMTCTWALNGRTVTFHVVSSRLPYFGYESTTAASIATDGTLTEQSPSPPNGTAIYPRTYRRSGAAVRTTGARVPPNVPLQLSSTRGEGSAATESIEGGTPRALTARN